jgi:hypothetical protein
MAARDGDILFNVYKALAACRFVSDFQGDKNVSISNQVYQLFCRYGSF